MARISRLAATAALTLFGAATLSGAAPPGLAYQLTHSVTADPSFSPNGARMVYLAVVAGKEQLFTANADGGDVVQITRDDADHEDPAWSPDGRKIAFVLMKDTAETIYIVNPDGSAMENLTPDNEKVIHPNWAPDGNSIIYCTDDDLKPPAKNAAEIETIDIATRKIRTLIKGGVNTYPQWSPDGKKIAFRKILGEMNSEVFLANADGSHLRNLTKHWSFDGWPAWSPDGSKIAFASNRQSNYQIYVMKPDGSDVTRLANTEGRATAPVWTRDGKQIYFTVCTRASFGSDCEIFVADAPH